LAFGIGKIVLDPRLADISLIEIFLSNSISHLLIPPRYQLTSSAKRFGIGESAIGGDGGDEMFGGYRRFYHADMAKSGGHPANGFLKATSATLGGISGIAPHLSRWARDFLVQP